MAPASGVKLAIERPQRSGAAPSVPIH
jgi:hypothetical protein